MVKKTRENLFRQVPVFHFTKELLRPGRQLKLERESKHAVNAFEEVQAASHLLLYLYSIVYTIRY